MRDWTVGRACWRRGQGPAMRAATCGRGAGRSCWRCVGALALVAAWRRRCSGCCGRRRPRSSAVGRGQPDGAQGRPVSCRCCRWGPLGRADLADPAAVDAGRPRASPGCSASGSQIDYLLHDLRVRRERRTVRLPGQRRGRRGLPRPGGRAGEPGRGGRAGGSAGGAGHDQGRGLRAEGPARPPRRTPCCDRGPGRSTRPATWPSRCSTSSSLGDRPHARRRRRGDRARGSRMRGPTTRCPRWCGPSGCPGTRRW